MVCAVHENGRKVLKVRKSTCFDVVTSISGQVDESEGEKTGKIRQCVEERVQRPRGEKEVKEGPRAEVEGQSLSQMLSQS